MTVSSFHYQKTWDALNRAARICVVIPVKPDGDNIGSALALFAALKAQGKTVVVVALGEIPDYFRFFPGIADVVYDVHTVTARPWDVMVVTDVSDPLYAGIGPLRDACIPRPLLVQIDHHATNTNFGDVNLVESRAASATVVVANLFRAMNVFVTPDIAICLLTGLLTDTGFFSNPATDEQALATGAFLLEHGADVRPLFKALVVNKDMKTLKVWGKTFERMRFCEKWGLVVTVLFNHELTDAGLTSESAEGIANFLNILSGVRAVCVLREETPGKLKASLRTTHPGVDVARLALLFGGGGHKKAAGFSMNGKLSEKNGRWEVEV
ncbi:MAG: DHH family phosphoesterase [bacterium]|nr:DHH family phosphoesterase [bacterium]